MLTHEQREALSDALHADRSRVGGAWDVSDVMGVVEAFLDGKPVKAKARPKRNEAK